MKDASLLLICSGMLLLFVGLYWPDWLVQGLGHHWRYQLGCVLTAKVIWLIALRLERIPEPSRTEVFHDRGFDVEPTRQVVEWSERPAVEAVKRES